MGRTRVKICCIGNDEEARMAINAGADALGLVSEMPSGPGVIPESRIAEIALKVPPPIATFLLTSLESADAITAQHQRCRTTTIQICDRLPSDAYGRLRDRLPGVRLVQVVHVQDEASFDEACRLAPNVDALLLDSGNPNLDVKELGGTGRRHDWRISRRIVESVNVPVFLAGGLNSENVRDAIERVAPYAVDVCSGVRHGGKLDAGRLEQFIERVHRG